MRKMPRFVFALITCALSLVVGSVHAEECGRATTGWLLPLGKYPLCEASAAIELPCPKHPDETCLWVADNESKKDLFQFRATSKSLQGAEQQPIPLGDPLEDAEALARSGDEVYVIGSHGRKSKCGREESRQRIVRVSTDASGNATSAVVAKAGEKEWSDRLAACATDLLRVAAADAPLAAQVCDAIAKAEKSADASPPSCVDVFNIEGAAMLSDAKDGKPRLWVGLRAPLVDGKAILLRVASLEPSGEPVSFDGVALLELRGRGIRELTLAGDRVFGIAGSVEDSEKPSFLFRLPASDVVSGALVTDVQMSSRPLPPSAEGLVIEGCDRALIVVDGNKDKDAKRCAPGAQQLVVPLD